MPKKIEGVAVRRPHQFESLVDFVLFIVIEHELSVRYVLGHRYIIIQPNTFKTIIKI